MIRSRVGSSPRTNSSLRGGMGANDNAHTLRVDVDEYSTFADRRTGFLPLHCLVASRMPKMIHWLLTLPDNPELHTYRAHVHKQVAVGSNTDAAGLTPLQLAVWLGDREMVRFLLNRYSKVMWRWGRCVTPGCARWLQPSTAARLSHCSSRVHAPTVDSLTQKRFELTEIDSIHPGASSVMELVCRVDALPRTKEMLGTGGKRDFMQGFLYELFVFKFDNFAWWIFYTFFVLDLAYLILLVNLSLTYRMHCGRSVPPQAVPTAVLIVIQYVNEIFIIVSWVQNHIVTKVSYCQPNRNPCVPRSVVPLTCFCFALWWQDAHLDRSIFLVEGVDAPLGHSSLGSRAIGTLRALRRLPFTKALQQIRDNHIDLKAFSLTTASVVLVLMSLSPSQRQKPPRFDPQSAGREVFSYLDSESADASGMAICAHTWPEPDWISFALALAFFCHTYAFVMESLAVAGKLIGVDALGKYTRFIVRMWDAVRVWLVVFVLFLFVFAITMHIIYPIPQQFRQFPDTLIALWLLATTGEPLVDFPPRLEDIMWLNRWPEHGVLSSPNGVAFTVMYFLWIYFSLVLLLNLLIAMMADEFDRVKRRADLEYRLGFARRVLRAELFATSLFGLFQCLDYAERMLRVGSSDFPGAPPCFKYVEVGRNAEGLKVQQDGVEDMFADNSDSENDDGM